MCQISVKLSDCVQTSSKSCENHTNFREITQLGQIKFKMESNIENHAIISMEHEIINESHTLIERKRRTIVENDQSEKKYRKTVIIHERVIDDRNYTMQKTLVPGQKTPIISVLTSLNEEEVDQFLTDWNELWKPKIEQSIFEK